MRRREFMRLLGTGILASAAMPKAFGEHFETPKKNILFIAVDDLRPQLGCYGHEEILSPNIDRLAAQGTVFSRAYCQVPVCGPSRVSVLTGLRTNSRQWRTSDLKDSFVTLPGHLKSQGYATLSLGKVFHHMNDSQDDWSEPPWRSEAIYHGPGDWAGYNAYHQWRDEESGNTINPRSKRGPYCEAADVPDEAYQDGKVAEKAVESLKRLKDMEEPFFLACGFWRPHLPFNAPKDYWDLYDRDKIDLAPNRFRPENLPKQCTSSGEIDQYGRTGKCKETEEFHREARHAYNACVSYVDAQIGKVLKALEELGLANDTVVVLWGDHGWHLGEHDFWGKHNTLHNALQAPLIVRAPGHSPVKGEKTNQLVEFIDIYPTVCELAGVPLPEHLQGTSLAPLLREECIDKEAAFGTWTGCRWVKTDRYLYTEWREGDQTVARMLFDHERDPQENKNVAEEPEYAEQVKIHSEMLMNM